jgi:membrane fusion protein, multidrug efflux system
MEAASKDNAVATARRRRARRAYLILGTVAVVVAGAWLGHRWLTKDKQNTDDAQVEADVVPLAARIGGVVKVARVHDNQIVKAGDVLFEVDPADLDVEVARADADLEAARAQQAAADAQVSVV